MANYLKLQQRADKMIKKYGQQMTMNLKLAPAYDASTGTNSSAVTTVAVNAAIFDWDLRKEGIMNEKGTLVVKGDRYALVSAVQLAANDIHVNDELVEPSGKIWSVSSIVMQLNPGGVNVVWQLGIDG